VAALSFETAASRPPQDEGGGRGRGARHLDRRPHPEEPARRVGVSKERAAP